MFWVSVGYFRFSVFSGVVVIRFATSQEENATLEVPGLTFPEVGKAGRESWLYAFKKNVVRFGPNVFPGVGLPSFHTRARGTLVGAGHFPN